MAVLSSRAAPERGFDRLNLFLCVVALVTWWEAGFRQGAEFREFPRASLPVAATILVLARVGASAVEALFYTLWWRARGIRLPYGRFLVALLALSLVDRLALGLAGLAGRVPALGPALAPVAGLHLLPGGFGPGLRAALGGVGALALIRVAITAWLQSSYGGVGMRGALAVTVPAWLATRLAAWWIVDLARGMSPLR